MALDNQARSASARKPVVVISGSPPPVRSKLWTPERNRALLRLIAQCGQNLCRVIMAEDLGIGGSADLKALIVNKRLRELNIEGTRI